MECLEIMGEAEQGLLFHSGCNYRLRRGDNLGLESINHAPCLSLEKEIQSRKDFDVKITSESEVEGGQASFLRGEVLIDKGQGQNPWTIKEQENLKEARLLQSDLTKNSEDKEFVQENNSGNEDKWVSVFIGNIPTFANNRWVFEIFKKIGKVTDYYVSSRVSKISNKPFGFVRFQSVEDANRAVDHFNGAWVDGCKLEVEIAKFPRRVVFNEAVRKSHIRTGEVCLGAGYSKNGLRSSIVHNSLISPNKSFAQVLQGRTVVLPDDEGRASSSRIKVKAMVKDCGWLKESLVAKIKWGVSVGDVMNGLMGHVNGLASINRLGIRKVILSFISGKDRDVAFSTDDWMGLVEDVSEWKGEVVCLDKVWKISCVGIPITAWNSDSFRSIAEVWGSLIYIDHATRSGEDYSVANFVIETKSDFSNTDIDLLVGNDIFTIKVSGTLVDVMVGNLDCQRSGDDAVNINVSDRINTCGKTEQVNMIQKGEVELLASKNLRNLAAESENIPVLNFTDVDISVSFEQDRLGKDSIECSDNKEERFIVSGNFNDRVDLFSSKAFGGRCGKEVAGVEKKCIERLDQVVYRMGNSGVINALEVQEVAYKGSVIEEAPESNPDPEFGQQGRSSANLSDDNLESETQTTVKTGSISGVEKEVRAMMDLGNLLDIPNPYQFEEFVRNTTMDDMIDESSSIGVRVKSKRKYTGKSKVQVGCRFKKG